MQGHDLLGDPLHVGYAAEAHLHWSDHVVPAALKGVSHQDDVAGAVGALAMFDAVGARVTARPINRKGTPKIGKTLNPRAKLLCEDPAIAWVARKASDIQKSATPANGIPKIAAGIAEKAARRGSAKGAQTEAVPLKGEMALVGWCGWLALFRNASSDGAEFGADGV